jgi:hypothetical protein
VRVVEGSLPEVTPGGVPIAAIPKLTEKILRVSHGKERIPPEVNANR